ncbi:MAG: uridine kinase [Eubacteriales bacterium]|nr:uridine kinase [Eubacteriales bacterium]
MEAVIETIVGAVEKLRREKDRVLVAIDGRCGSGKSTLADRLKTRLDANLIHMDDFYLRPEQRTAERRREPGGNVDYERFLEEVLKPLAAGERFCYRPFDCRAWRLGEPVAVEPKPVTVVEGSYSCHPSLWTFYDLRIFLTVEPEEQLRRIRERTGKATCADMFRDKWIPLEELYFSKLPVRERCGLAFDMTKRVETES